MCEFCRVWKRIMCNNNSRCVTPVGMKRKQKQKSYKVFKVNGVKLLCFVVFVHCWPLALSLSASARLDVRSDSDPCPGDGTLSIRMESQYMCIVAFLPTTNCYFMCYSECRLLWSGWFGRWHFSHCNAIRPQTRHSSCTMRSHWEPWFNLLESFNDLLTRERWNTPDFLHGWLQCSAGDCHGRILVKQFMRETLLWRTLWIQQHRGTPRFIAK